MKKWYKLEEIEDFEHTAANFFKASYAPTLINDAVNIDLWDDDDFKDIFEQQEEKSIYLKETNDAWGAFKNKYSQWISRNGSLIANELYTLLMKYNPIHNYDRHEVYSGKDTSTKKPTDWIETVTDTPDNWKQTTTQTPTNWQKTNEKSFTNRHDTETETPTNWEKTTTQTPTNWKETETDSFTNYHETDTQTPTNWEKTTTQTPTLWEKTSTDTFTNYTETDTQTPTNWVKTTQTAGGSNANSDATRESIVPFNGSDLAMVSGKDVQHAENITETQAGTYQNQKTITGSKTNTEAQTGTYQTTEAQDGTFETTEAQGGTFETDKTFTGTKQKETAHTGTYEVTEEQGGTYERDREMTGKETVTETQAGTFKTEVEESGSKVVTKEQEGTFEDEMAYGKKVDISGNIGTLTTGAMIRETLEIYDNDFIAKWINRFFNTYCAYV